MNYRNKIINILNSSTLKFYISLSFYFFLLLQAKFAVAQQAPKSLSVECYDSWQILRARKLSDDGQWMSYQADPQKGDGLLCLKNMKTGDSLSFERAHNLRFAADASMAVFQIKAQHDSLRALKLAKTKKDKLPKDSLGIICLKDKQITKIPRVKSFTMAERGGHFFYYQHEKNPDDSTKSPKKFKFLPDTTSLTILNPLSDKAFDFYHISNAHISKFGDRIAFTKLKTDTAAYRSVVSIFDTKTEQVDSIFAAPGLVKKLAFDEKGRQLAFIHSSDTIKERSYTLYYSQYPFKTVVAIVDTTSADIPKGWTVSEFQHIFFSKDGQKLFFHTAPPPYVAPKDTLLNSEKVDVDIWHWKDPLLQTQQLAELEKEKKRAYLAVYFPKKEKVVQLANTDIPHAKPLNHGDCNKLLAWSYEKYQQRISWDYPAYRDVYIIDAQTGKAQLLATETQDRFSVSPTGDYFVWYATADSNWYCRNLRTKKEHCLTSTIEYPLYEEDHDYPFEAFPYGIAGWTADKHHLLIYDRYDIWKLDLRGREQAVNLTQHFGRQKHINFHYERLDKEEVFIDLDKDLFLSAFDENSKYAGYYALKAGKEVRKLTMGAYRYRYLIKARDAQVFMWQKENFQTVPALWYSDDYFQQKKQVSWLNPQQKDYLWGSVELVSWLNFDGDSVQGLLYKPENFDPDKQYPAIVYFYRRYSDNLYRHWTPHPSYSIINPTHYVSNGYVVFIPDIKYKTGYPGESAYNHVVSGTMAMINKGFIDKDRIGIQGQSWGGYQVAYIITKTDLFAAASAGAPVSNMLSAYGGIRWKTGKSRMYQYEQSQSRIGGTLWEKPLHYIENSPLFYAPKINTPLLIRHNDKDGAVPWYQGIELFVALRRLQKPVWLINYNNAPHNLTKKQANRIDFTIRMKQFFDHYLKGEPAPVWLQEPIPAIEQERDDGYQHINESKTN